jgi:hypothetical protein
MDFFTTDETTIPWFLTVESPPAAPSDLLATTIGTDRVSLAWIDNSINEAGFRIERKNQSSSFVEIALVAPEVESYLDTALLPGTKYMYRVRAFNGGGTSLYSNKASATTVAGKQAGPGIVAHPNPFNPATKFHFTLTSQDHVSLKIFNMLGQEVATVVEDYLLEGAHQIRWDTGNNGDFRVSSGTYFAVLRIGSKVTSIVKIMLVR